MKAQSPIDLNSIVIAFFPIGDHGTKRQVERYVSRRYGVPQSHVVVHRPEPWEIGTLVAATGNLVPLEYGFPAKRREWTPYVVVRGVDLET
jgi:hypothetical protein